MILILFLYIKKNESLSLGTAKNRFLHSNFIKTANCKPKKSFAGTRLLMQFFSFRFFFSHSHQTNNNFQKKKNDFRNYSHAQLRTNNLIHKHTHTRKKIYLKSLSHTHWSGRIHTK